MSHRFLMFSSRWISWRTIYLHFCFSYSGRSSCPLYVFIPLVALDWLFSLCWFMFLSCSNLIHFPFDDGRHFNSMEEFEKLCVVSSAGGPIDDLLRWSGFSEQYSARHSWFSCLVHCQYNRWLLVLRLDSPILFLSDKIFASEAQFYRSKKVQLSHSFLEYCRNSVGSSSVGWISLCMEKTESSSLTSTFFVFFLFLLTLIITINR